MLTNSECNLASVLTIEHSGQSFTSIGKCKICGCRIWPIEEYIARTHHGPKIVERIKQMNPNGKCEVNLPHGIGGPQYGIRQLMARGYMRTEAKRYLKELRKNPHLRGRCDELREKIQTST